ncbi:M48 family metalloprotease [Micromonospora chalcea]
MDPTTLPSDVRARLYLSIVMICSGSLFFTSLLSGDPDASEACTAVADRSVPVIATAADWQEHTRSWQSCMVPVERANGVAMLTGFSFLLLASGIYQAQAGWRAQRRGLRPLPLEHHANLARTVQRYSREAGLSMPPTLYHDVRPGATAAAFGRSADPVLALGQGMLIDYAGDRRRFDAVLHHELFHIRDRDVSVYYRSLAVFRSLAFTVTAYATVLLVFMAIQLSLVLSAIMAAQLVITLLVGQGMLRDYLRQREFRADIYAVGQAGTEAVAEMLRAGPGNRHVLQRFLGSHPQPAERVAALHRPHDALRLNALAAALTGVAVSVLGANTAFLVSKAGLWTSNFYAFIVGGAAAGAVFGGILAVGIWRNVQLDLAAGRRPRQGLRCGLAGAAGLLAGGLLPLQLSFDDGGPLFSLAWQSLAAAACVVAFVLWLGFVGRLRLRSAAHVADRRRFREGIVAGTATGACLFAALFAHAALLRARRSTLSGLDDGVFRSDGWRPLSDNQLTAAMLTDRPAGWPLYAAVGLALLGLIAMWLRGGRRGYSKQDLQGVPAVSRQAAAAPSSATAEPVTERPSSPGAGLDPQTRGQRYTLMLVMLTAVVAVIAVAAATPYVPLLVVVATTSLGFAWADFRARRIRRSAVVAAYTLVSAALVLTMVPLGMFSTLAIAFILLFGTVAGAKAGIPVPGNMHTVALLAPALLLHHQLWILLAWLVVGAGIGLGIFKLVRARQDAWERPVNLGLAIAGVLAIAVEFALR